MKIFLGVREARIFVKLPLLAPPHSHFPTAIGWWIGPTRDFLRLSTLQITQAIGVNTDEEDIMNYRELYNRLEVIKMGQTRTILLFVTGRYAEHIFKVAERLGILGREWAWLVSEQCLGASNLPLG